MLEENCRFIDLPQNSPEWYRWRHDGIGASDAPLITQTNPYKPGSRHFLLHEKLQANPSRASTRPAAVAGKLTEPRARQAYSTQTLVSVRPVCVQSTMHEWMRASLDGLSSDNTRAVEIKTGARDYSEVHSTRRVPSMYRDQLQHILAVTRLPMIDVWFYNDGRPSILLKQTRDDTRIAYLLDEERKFWAEVLRGRGQRSAAAL